MTFRFVKLAVLFFLAAVFAFSYPAAAQQITYYDFDALNPVAGQPLVYSYSCGASNSASILFCFNNPSAGAITSYPVLFQDGYPAALDPNPADNPPAASTHTTLQMTQAVQGQGSSAWFAVPQKVLNGFTAYVAFRLAPVPVTSDPTTATNADGVAFVIQNALGGGSITTSDGTACSATGSGLSVSGSGGGCIGYGGIDNSLAVEFDTYQNGYDPNNNHIALQSCGLSSGVGLPNSPDHTTCQVKDAVSANPAINSALGISLADGNVHQAVIEYSGAAGTPANQWQVYIDPVFIAGTHTPDPTQSTAAITTTVNLSQYMNLQNSGSANDSAYVGFTGGTGYYYENQEILAWTFTPHTTVTQPQPLQPAGSPTTFPFGSHTYAVTYPAGGPSTSGIDMIVNANTISPADFAALIAPTPFVGSQCQVYEGTGGNCIIYSVYCVTDGTTTKVACPATSDPTIAVKTAYESDNSVPPVSPGFLQGDPFFSQISTISGDGTTATASCTGECAITVVPPATTQTVTIAGNSVAGLNGTFQATPTGIDTFTFSSSVTGPGNGGYVTSHNVSNICDGPSDPTPCWQPAKIDGTTSGKTKNFSDLVALSNTVNILNTTTAISVTPISYGGIAQITVSVSPSPITVPGPVTGSVSLSVDGNAPTSQTLASGSATFSIAGLSGGNHSLSAAYAAQGSFGASGTTGTQMVTPITPVITWTPAAVPLGAALGAAQLDASANVAGSFTYTPPSGTVVSTTSQSVVALFTPAVPANYNTVSTTLALTVKAGPEAQISPPSIAFGTVYLGTISIRNVTVTNAGNAAMAVTGPLLSVVKGGDSNEFVEVNLCPKSLAAGKSCTVTVAFVAGPFYTLQTATLNIMDNAPGNPQPIALSATVINPQATLNASSLNFGNQTEGKTSPTKTVTLKNPGGTALAIMGITVAGANPGDFLLSPACPSSLGPGLSCTIGVAFNPSSKTSRSATLTIKDNALTSPQTVPLSGKGD